VGIITSLPVQAFAQTPTEGECSFLGVKNSDRVGRTSAKPDGKPDAVFSLSPKPGQEGAKMREIQIVASDPPGLWSTSSAGPGTGFMGVALAKNPSDILNRSGGEALNLAPQQSGQLLLFITDDDDFAQKKRRYQVRVIYTDGSSWNAPVKIDGGSSVPEQSVKPGVFSVRMSAVLKGISTYDAVNPSKKISGDDKGDGLFELTVEARNKEITGIEIRNVDGVSSVWDTIESSSYGAIGVAMTSDPVRLLNRRDASVRIPVKDRVDLNLYVADNGSIEGGNTNYRITVNFSDGEISWCPVQRQEKTAKETGQEKPAGIAPKVNFLATWLGFASTDAVGRYPEIKPDGIADAVFGLDIEISPRNFITGIEIKSMDGKSGDWATGGINPSAWGLGVAYQTAPTALLNKPDGSIRIAADNRVQFFLYVADTGDLASSNATLRVIVHLADGSSFQQFAIRPPSTTSTVAPGTDETSKARGIITCEFRGFIADLVNTSTKPGKDGYLDGTFITKLQVDDKKLVKIDISGDDGATRWSSDPKPPTMFLGIALYPKIYKLLNEKGGPMHLPIAGRATLYLYAADNGLLSDPKTRLVVTVTFSDKTTLSTPVIK
jgi:hypothetical protein